MVYLRCIYLLHIFSTLANSIDAIQLGVNHGRNDQSKTCTPEENAKLVQCLRELPAEKYEVLEGEDVQMRCRIAHQRGKAQWRARNFLLGYIRSIPSWPRYSMQGNSHLGVHDLLIRNVSHEDAGTFECQVSPAEGQAPLRRQTNLVILIKPDQPEIIAPTGEPQPSPNGQLIVPLPYFETMDTESETLRLFCQARGGKPVPIFEWFHNGVSITAKTDRYESYDEEFDKLQIDETDNEEEIHSAEITLKRLSLNTGDRLVCLVSNKATLRSKQLSHQKLRAELFVVIHSPPGPPKLINWVSDENNSHAFEEGSSMEATCRSEPAGNPPGEIVWRWTNMEKFGPHKLFPMSQTKNMMTTIPSKYVESQYSDDALVSKVRIPVLNATRHGAQLVCGVKHQVGPEQTTNMTVLVRYGPNELTVIGPETTIAAMESMMENNSYTHDNEQQSNVYHVFADRPQYLLCYTGPYFDHAWIKWYGLSNETNQWEELKSTKQLSYTVGYESRHYILYSAIEVISSGRRIGALRWDVVKCVTGAINRDEEADLKGMIERRVILKKYEPPGKPKISGYNHDMLYREGSNISLTCEAEIGSPPGDLFWIFDLKKETKSVSLTTPETTQQTSGNRLWTDIEIHLTREMNKKSLRCASSNRGYNISDNRVSEPIHLAVAYSAKEINMTVADESKRQLYPRSNNLKISKINGKRILDPASTAGDQPRRVTVDADTTIRISCRVDSANPRPIIRWRLHHCPLSVRNISSTAHATTGFSTKHCDVLPLEAEDSVGSTLYTESIVHLSLNWSHHGDVVECFTKPGRNQFQHTTTSLSRDLSTSRSVGVDVEFTSSQHLLSERVLLNVRFKPVFVRTTGEKEWVFQVLDTNQLASGRLPQYIAMEGGTIKLVLEPLANPSVDRVMWMRQNEILATNTKTKDTSHSRITFQDGTLYIHPVKTDDMTNYTLMASNSMGSSRFLFFLNVTYGPKLIGQPEINVTATGRKAVLECVARANPMPILNGVRWRRLSHSFAGMELMQHLYTSGQSNVVKKQEKGNPEADSITGIRCNKGEWHDGFKYFARCLHTSSGLMKSTLTIYDLGPADVGRYQCHMDNAIGSPAVRIVDLIYPFAPRVIQMPRWSRAASNAHTFPPSPMATSLDAGQARLTCVIAAEPKPTVDWTREPANLTLVEGGQFKSVVRVIHPGLYHAILFLNRANEADLGRYFCHARNLVGRDVGRVEMIKPSRPDIPPNRPRLINATSTSLAIVWTQAFNGGPGQYFQVRWAPNEHPEQYEQNEVQENLFVESLVYVIRGLKKATTYRVVVRARNVPHGSTAFTPYLLASTKVEDPIPNEKAMRDEAGIQTLISMTSGHWDLSGGQADSVHLNRLTKGEGAGHAREDQALTIIIAASIFGALVLIGNLFIILLLSHRKRKRMTENKTNSGNDLMRIYPNKSSFNDLKSEQRPIYATYMDGSSLNEEMLIQGRATEQFSPFHGGVVSSTNMPLGFNENQSFNGQTYAGSPHPSLQAIIHSMRMNTPTQMDYNSGAQFSPTQFTDTSGVGMGFGNIDVQQQMMNFHGASSLPHHPDEYTVNTLEGRTPISVRTNTGFSMYPVTHGRRADSPHSGAASSISAARSSGYPNTHSLERNNSGYLLASRLPSNPNMVSLSRQSTYRQYTPTENVGRTPSDYGGSDNMRSNTSTFSTNQTLTQQQARMRNHPMTASYYRDRGISRPNMSSDDTVWQNDIIVPAMGTGQLMRRSSCNSYRQVDPLIKRLNECQIVGPYLQRYNEQLQAVRAMGRQLSPTGLETGIVTNHSSMQRTHPDIQQPTDSLIIPPPNAFGSVTSPLSPSSITFPNSATVANNTNGLGTNVVRPIYRGSDEETETDLADNIQRNHANFETPNAPIKHPSPDQSLLLKGDRQNSFAHYGRPL